MTGMYEYVSGCNFSHGSLSESLWQQMSYPVALRKAGYFTGFIGKFGFPLVDGGGDYHKMENLPVNSFDRWISCIGINN